MTDARVGAVVTKVLELGAPDARVGGLAVKALVTRGGGLAVGTELVESLHVGEQTVTSVHLGNQLVYPINW